MTITARFQCVVVEEHSHAEAKYCEQITLRPVYSNDPASPNYSWSQATPAGQLTMTITNPGAFGAFVSGEDLRRHPHADQVMFADMKLGRISAPLPSGMPSLDAHPIWEATPAPVVDRSSLAFKPTMGGNDVCSDCTCVALANAILLQAELAGWDVLISDQAIKGLYSEATAVFNGLPYTPGNDASDTGLVEVKLLAYQARMGFDTGAQTPYVGLWANIPVDHLDMLRLATERMGSGFVGLELAEADQVGGEVLDIDTPASFGDPTPGSWGGHGAIVIGYDNRAPDDDPASVWQLSTWAKNITVTTRWLKSRLYELHTVVHPQMLGPDGLNPAGLDRDRLAADVASFGAVA